MRGIISGYLRIAITAAGVMKETFGVGLPIRGVPRSWTFRTPSSLTFQLGSQPSAQPFRLFHFGGRKVDFWGDIERGMFHTFIL